MKKYSYAHIATIVIIAFSLLSCTKEEEPATKNIAVEKSSFKNGRMVFTSYEQMNAKMDELFAMDQLTFKNWEESNEFTSYSTYRQNCINENYNNYKSMGENAPVMEYNNYIMPDWSMVTNQNGEYQVGDSVYFFVDNKRYGILYEGEDKLNKEKEGILKNPLNSKSKNRSVSEIKIDTLENSTNLKSADYLDSRYQKQFDTNGHTYKFVFESFSRWDGTGSTVWVQSKLHYWHKRSWPFSSYWDDAGESIYKTTSNFYINDVFGDSQLANSLDKNRVTFNNQYLVIKSKTAQFTSGTYVKIGGTMYAYTNCFEKNSSFSVTSTCLWEANLY